MYDILIKDGTIVDGSGRPGYLGSVAIKNERIVAVGSIEGGAKQIIDANGMIIAPGFIDVLTHADSLWNIFENPTLEGFLQQGTTTIIGGHCGSSLAPLANPEALRAISRWRNPEGLAVDWSTMKEFLGVVERMKLGVNFGTLVGYSTIRYGLAQYLLKKSSSTSFAQAERLLQDALRSGALGISVGLGYAPEEDVAQEDLMRLGHLVQRNGKVLGVHLRDERENLLVALNEVVHISEETHARAHISHLRVRSTKVSPQQAVDFLENSTRNNIRVTFDVYPYGVSAVTLLHLLPSWVLAGGKEVALGRIQDRTLRPKIVQEIKSAGLDIASLKLSKIGSTRALAGKTVLEVSQKTGLSPEEALLDIILLSKGEGAGFLSETQDVAVPTLLKSSLALIASDGGGYPLKSSISQHVIHPRNFGAMPMVLGQYVREKHILTLEEAVQKMTSLPASVFGIRGRGYIAPDYFADLCIFDPLHIQSHSDLDNPLRYPEGVRAVIINGRVALYGGNLLAGHEGKIIIS